MGRGLGIWAVLAMGLGLLSGCASESPVADGPTASRPTVPPPTTNPYVVPDVIDEAYVNTVLAGLDHVMGELTRLVVATRAISPEVLDRMRALWVAEPPGPHTRLQNEIAIYEDGILRGFPNTKIPPADAVTRVAELITASPSCIFAKVTYDLSAGSVSPGPILSHWVALLRLDPANDPHHYNPTFWVFAINGIMPDRSQPPNICAGS